MNLSKYLWKIVISVNKIQMCRKLNLFMVLKFFVLGLLVKVCDSADK